MAPRKMPPGLPSREAVLDFIRDSPTPVGRREIARAFNIKGADRIPLKAMLKELAVEGKIDLGRHRRAAAPGTLPEVTVVSITGIDDDGNASARPLTWREENAPPAIIIPLSSRTPSVGVGDRALVKLERTDQDQYRGRIMRRRTAGLAATMWWNRGDFRKQNPATWWWPKSCRAGGWACSMSGSPKCWATPMPRAPSA